MERLHKPHFSCVMFTNLNGFQIKPDLYKLYKVETNLLTALNKQMNKKKKPRLHSKFEFQELKLRNNRKSHYTEQTRYSVDAIDWKWF